MATIEFGGVFKDTAFFTGARLAQVTFSGVVTVDGSFASREVVGYNTNNPTGPYTTQSDGTTGAWSLTIKMGLAETVRIICVGEDGENSAIYEHLVE